MRRRFRDGHPSPRRSPAIADRDCPTGGDADWTPSRRTPGYRRSRWRHFAGESRRGDPRRLCRCDGRPYRRCRCLCCVNRRARPSWPSAWRRAVREWRRPWRADPGRRRRPCRCVVYALRDALSRRRSPGARGLDLGYQTALFDHPGASMDGQGKWPAGRGRAHGAGPVRHDGRPAYSRRHAAPVPPPTAYCERSASIGSSCEALRAG